MTAPAPPNKCADLLAAGPRAMVDVPAYLMTLDDAQRRAVWVALVIDNAFDAEGRFISSRRELLAALLAARDGGRSVMSHPPRAMTGPQVAGRTRPRWGVPTSERLMAVAMERLAPGQSARLSELFERQSDRQAAARVARNWPGFVTTKAGKGRPGKPALIVQRMAAAKEVA